MPAIMTHDFFGQDAFGCATEVVGLYTPSERDAFLLGNQGPDPLFYIRLIPAFDEFAQLGSQMHAAPPAELFCSLRQAVDELPDDRRPVGRAYLAGFACHYLLDRAMHPLVYFWERGICQAGVEDLDFSDAGIVHAEIERDLDEMVLYAKRNQTVRTYKPYEQVLRADDTTLDTVGDVYYPTMVQSLGEEEPSLARVFPLAVLCFRIVQRIFWSPGQRKASLLGHVEGPLFHNRYSLVRAMSHRVREESTSDFDNRDHRPWRNPFTRLVRTDSFWDIYNATLLEVPKALNVVLAEDFSEEELRAFMAQQNFSGELVE